MLAVGRSVHGLRRVVTERLDVALAPALLPALFLVVVGLAVLGGGVLVVLAAVQAWWLGALALAVVPPAVAVVIAAARVACELALAISRITARSGELASGLSRMETMVGGIADDMPRLGFLRLGRGPVDREEAGTGP